MAMMWGSASCSHLDADMVLTGYSQAAEKLPRRRKELWCNAEAGWRIAWPSVVVVVVAVVHSSKLALQQLYILYIVA